MKLNIGDTVQISEGSGLDSGKIVSIVPNDMVKLGSQGIPTNVAGAYYKPDWTKEVAIQYENGEIGLMFKNRLIPVEKKKNKLEDFSRFSDDAIKDLYYSNQLSQNEIEKLVKSGRLKIEEKKPNKLKSFHEVEKNERDSICTDVPLFIRLLEYAREDSNSDIELHNIAEKATERSSTGKLLTMNDYIYIVDNSNLIKSQSSLESTIEDARYNKNIEDIKREDSLIISENNVLVFTPSHGTTLITTSGAVSLSIELIKNQLIKEGIKPTEYNIKRALSDWINYLISKP